MLHVDGFPTSTVPHVRHPRCTPIAPNENPTEQTASRPIAATLLAGSFQEVPVLHALLLCTSLSFATDVDLPPREAAILDAVEAMDPSMIDPLLELRETQPEAYRKKLQHFARIQQKKAQQARLRNDPDMAGDEF